VRDQFQEAAADLDFRRITHEGMQPRTKRIERPASRAEMCRFIRDFGPTDIAVDNEDFRHCPVVPVAGGIAFRPERMTLAMLEDVYMHLLANGHKGGACVSAGVSLRERVEELFAGNTGGMRLEDIAKEINSSAVWRVRAVLRELEEEGMVRIVEEPNPRKGATKRKRYYPALHGEESYRENLSFDVSQGF
jgi:hypothetical protein